MTKSLQLSQLISFSILCIQNMYIEKKNPYLIQINFCEHDFVILRIPSRCQSIFFGYVKQFNAKPTFSLCFLSVFLNSLPFINLGLFYEHSHLDRIWETKFAWVFLVLSSSLFYAVSHRSLGRDTDPHAAFLIRV